MMHTITCSFDFDEDQCLLMSQTWIASASFDKGRNIDFIANQLGRMGWRMTGIASITKEESFARYTVYFQKEEATS